MSKQVITLAFDWVGPQGFWPNGLSLDYYYSKKTYEQATYSVGNKKHIYDLESKRHPFTFSKLEHVLDKEYEIEYKHIKDVGNKKYIYELTPLLKPYQWLDDCFRDISFIVKNDNRLGKNIIIINDMNEGYGNTYHSFFKKLHDEIIKEQLNPHNIFYISMNSILPDLYDEWRQKNDVVPIRMLSVYIYEYQYEKVSKQKTKHFISLNRSPNPQRHAFVYELWRRDLLKYGYVSFPHKDEILDYNISENDLVDFGLDTSRWNEFLDALPFTVDKTDFTRQDCYNKPIHEYYSESYFAVISEQTFDDDECIKFSEKTFMTLNNNCLPVYLYSKNAAKTLQSKLGYQTIFDSYDTLSNKKERFHAVLDTIERLCSLDLKTLHKKTYKIIRSNDNLFNKRTRSHAGLKDTMKEINEWLRFS